MAHQEIGLRPPGAVLKDWVRALEATALAREATAETLASVVLAAAAGRGDAPALLGRGEQFSHGELAGRANRYARWALAQGLRPGEVVGLLMPNRPEYVAIWLGLSQVGCVVALLNTQIRADALAHSIGSAAARHVIVDAALAEQASAAERLLPPGTTCWRHGAGAAEDARIDGVVARLDGAPLTAAEQRLPVPRDRALLLYTSGTTGFPKAANVSHARVLEWSRWFAGMMDVRPQDRLYDCLPLYHSVGGIVAVGSMLLAGGAVVIRERFSASRFWDDVADSGCTIVQYIGELCRYLLQSPPQPREAAHQVRLFCGNGLRGEIWQPFQRRFAIPRILEFYAATEGVVSLYNCEGKPGAIGRVPAFLAHRFPVALVRCDPESGEPLRGADGLCQRSAPDEPGEAIGRISMGDGSPSRWFDGYTDPSASARKVLADVFMPSDCWFRTGDLMRKDAAGYYYFVDRLGDTFRWKGENVATAEVAAVLAACPGVLEAVVYGVALPGNEGKAGMAALVADAHFSLDRLRDQLEAALPAYARPLFVRLCPAIDTTGTFRLSKTTLAGQGYASDWRDPVWFDDRNAGQFVPLDPALRQRLDAGELRL